MANTDGERMKNTNCDIQKIIALVIDDLIKFGITAQVTYDEDNKVVFNIPFFVNAEPIVLRYIFNISEIQESEVKEIIEIIFFDLDKMVIDRPNAER